MRVASACYQATTIEISSRRASIAPRTMSLQIPAAIRSGLSRASEQCVSGANGIPLCDGFPERTIRIITSTMSLLSCLTINAVARDN